MGKKVVGVAGMAKVMDMVVVEDTKSMGKAWDQDQVLSYTHIYLYSYSNAKPLNLYVYQKR